MKLHQFNLYGLVKCTTAIVLISLTMISNAMTSKEVKGLEIAIEIDRRDAGFGDSKSDMTMILRNAHGEENTRSMRSRILEQENDGDKSMLIFDNPRDVMGTAFLSFTHKEGPDSQWLYLPALKRVKRISSSNKSGPFVGSEFAYEDISSQEVEKYTYEYERDETLDDRNHYVIKRYPVDPKSGYSYQTVWVDKNEYRIWKVDFYDRKEELLKTLKLSNYEIHAGSFWRANTWLMENHQTQKSTELRFSDWEFKNGYSDRDFTKSMLSKVR